MTDAEKTLKTLRKINDFPFYYAEYHGDYKIRKFKAGAISSPHEIVPFFQSLFSDLGKPIELSFPEPPETGFGCSAFFCRNENNSALIGKNLDWKKDPLLLLKTTPDKGFASLSMVNLNFCDLFQLGSIDYKLLSAPYIPLDGMNEKGLVVTMLSVHEGAEYPGNPEKITVGDFNIIRIILDTCANVDEAIAVIKQYNISQTGLYPLHYLISDSEESCIVEFFNGNIHLKRNKNKNYLTNFLCLKNAEFEILKNQCGRYQILENELEINERKLEIAEAKEILKRLSVYTPDFELPSTIWSLIYIPENLTLKIRIGDESKYYSITLGEN